MVIDSDSVADSLAAGFQAGRSPLIQNTVNLKYCTILPSDRQGSQIPLSIKSCGNRNKYFSGQIKLPLFFISFYCFSVFYVKKELLRLKAFKNFNTS